MGARRIDPPPEKRHFLDHGFRDQPGKALCARPARHNAHLRLGQGQCRAGYHDPDIASGGQFQPTAKSRGMDHGDGRLRQSRQPVKNAMPLAHPITCEVKGRKLRPSGDIRTRAKGTIPFGSHDHAQHIARALQCGAMPLQLRQHLGGKGVQLGRVIQHDLRDWPVDLQMHGTHGAHPIG